MSEELPEGWATARLGELAVINPRHPKGLDDTMPVTFAPMAALSESEPGIQVHEERPLGLVRKGFTHFAEGDVLFAKITPCMENGKGAVASGLRNGLGCGTTELHVVRPLAGIDAHYVYHFLAQPSVRRAAKENFTGTAGQARVPTSFIEGLEFPLPPLAEQRRIVALLEALLGKVAACQRRLAKIPALLKRFRQSVLAAACSGRLTADWREACPDARFVVPPSGGPKARGGPRERVATNQNAEADQVMSDVPNAWQVTRLGELTALVTSGSRGWAEYYADSGSIFIRAQNISTDALDLGDVAYVQLPQRAEGLRTRVRRDDILVTITGANVTKSALVRGEIADAYVSQHVALVRLVDPSNAPFLFLWIISPSQGRRQLLAAAYGQGKPGLNLGNIQDVVCALPPLPEQREIVRRAESLFALADRIEARFAEAKAQVDRLTQALLAKAFRGELVPQDPNDEPASALLERVGAQSQRPPPRRTRSCEERSAGCAPRLPATSAPPVRNR
jgi:type I restriction enzyme S subunit